VSVFCYIVGWGLRFILVLEGLGGGGASNILLGMTVWKTHLNYDNTVNPNKKFLYASDGHFTTKLNNILKFVPCIIRRSRNNHSTGKCNRWNHDTTRAHRPRNYTLHDIPPIRSVFQEIQTNPRTYLMMADYCRNM
jgi:hypothetical protein